jgi:hypothetical protein
VSTKSKKQTAPDAILKFRKKTPLRFFLRLSFQIPSFIDLHKNLLSYGKFMLRGHLDFVSHFVYFASLLKFIIGSTLNLRGIGKILKK